MRASEWVLQVTGLVRHRPQGAENPNLATGEIEIEVQTCEVLNPSKPLPFLINKDEDTDENVRLKYRYLDLRRERMQNNLILRHKVIKFMRDYLDKQGFIEVETPMLFKTTPEGARDYLVPSRVHPGYFYALPQSPQQLKQLLMVAGIERYFQIARCFRDEDLRGDRQPEFTQLDLEMSFVHRDDVLAMVEGLFTAMLPAVAPHKHLLSSPWPRLTYQEAVNTYGSDKPDLRFGMEVVRCLRHFCRQLVHGFSEHAQSRRRDQVHRRPRLRRIHPQGSRRPDHLCQRAGRQRPGDPGPDRRRRQRHRSKIHHPRRSGRPAIPERRQGRAT